MLEVFSKLKCSLRKNVVLCFPCPSDIIVLCTGVSAGGVGGVLCVRRREKKLLVERSRVSVLSHRAGSLSCCDGS